MFLCMTFLVLMKERVNRNTIGDFWDSIYFYNGTFSEKMVNKNVDYFHKFSLLLKFLHELP
jgi:hypothetical protein